MRLLHRIVEIQDKKTGLPSEKSMHRVGRKVHVGELSLRNSVMMYHSDGITVTSPVEEWTEDIRGSLEIVTSNNIYFLERTI
jgi:hypothetical protein